MRILVLNGSPSGENSVTLQTVLYIQKHFPQHDYEVLPVGQRIRALEQDPSAWRGSLERAELIMFCYPVYTFLVPAQLHRFIEMMKESGLDLRGRFATQISTSKHFYDTTAHRFIEDCCEDMGLKVIRGLSADMEDLLHPQGQREALDFFRYVLWNVGRGEGEPVAARAPALSPAQTHPEAEPLSTAAPGRVVIVADTGNSAEGRLQAMCERLRRRLPCECRVLDLQDFDFAGGCLGCFRCAADGTCVYRDGFDRWLREEVQSADALVYAFTVRDHSMGSRFKLFDDRQFCNGHRTVTMGKPVGYLVDGPLDGETNLRQLIEARAQVGGNALAGIATNQRDPDAEIDRLAAALCYAATEGWQPPRNFYGVGGMKIFRDLIWQMQGLMREDHRFYRRHGFYDFPQKHRAKMLAMYLAGGMMRSPRLRRKIGGRMTEGMILPYRWVVEKAAPSGEEGKPA